MGLSLGRKKKGGLVFGHSQDVGMGTGNDPRRRRWDILVSPEGDGDCTTIKDALDLLPSTGGIIYVSEGTYTITSTLSITKSGTKIFGSGNNTKIVYSSANPIINVGDGTNAISNVLIKDVYLGGDYNATIGIQIRKGTDITIDTINVVQVAYGIGVFADANSVRIKITNSHFSECAESIYIYSDYSTIIGNTMLDQDGGIVLRNSLYSVVSQNIIKNITQYGIFLYDNTRECTVVGNVINHAESGIEMYGEGFNRVEKCTIVGNTCIDCNTAGIETTNFVRYCTITGNVCNENTVGINIGDEHAYYNNVVGNIAMGNFNDNFIDLGEGTGNTGNLFVDPP